MANKKLKELAIMECVELQRGNKVDLKGILGLATESSRKNHNGIHGHSAQNHAASAGLNEAKQYVQLLRPIDSDQIRSQFPEIERRLNDGVKRYYQELDDVLNNVPMSLEDEAIRTIKRTGKVPKHIQTQIRKAAEMIGRALSELPANSSIVNRAEVIGTDLVTRYVINEEEPNRNSTKLFLLGALHEFYTTGKIEYHAVSIF